MQSVVVGDGVARDVVHRIRHSDVARAATDDDGDLAFVIEIVAVRGANHGAAVAVESRHRFLEVRRRRCQFDAEFTDARDVVEMTTEDLARIHWGQVSGGGRFDATPVARHQRVAVEEDARGISVQQNPAILHAVPPSRLCLNDNVTLLRRRRKMRVCVLLFVMS